VRVAPVGELDLVGTPRLEQTIRDLLASGFDRLVVDLTNVEFIDSTGLRLLLALQASADEGTLALEIRPGPPAVQRIFELTGTLHTLTFA